MDIKAIETNYKGYRFRSRLEARWAVFFDSLGVKYEYEKEGYDLGELGYYLPDFWLPEVHGGLWVEIKPVGFDDDKAISKIHSIVKGTKQPATILIGEPMGGYLKADGYDDCPWWSIYIYHEPNPNLPRDDGVGQDFPYIFCVCPWCEKVGFEFDGRGARICKYTAHYDNEEEAQEASAQNPWVSHFSHMDKCYTGTHPKILRACIAARSARF
jgi:hypothetical protein